MKTTRMFVHAVVGLAFVACASGRSMAWQSAGTSSVQTGIAHFQQGQYAEAVSALQGQGGVEANAYLAASLARLGRFDEAVGAADTALRDDPVHALAVGALGQALVGLKRWDDAVARLSRVIDQRKDLAYAYYWRGQAYSGKKQVDRMVPDYETFVKLAPDAPEATSVRQLLAALR